MRLVWYFYGSKSPMVRMNDHSPYRCVRTRHWQHVEMTMGCLARRCRSHAHVLTRRSNYSLRSKKCKFRVISVAHGHTGQITKIYFKTHFLQARLRLGRRGQLDLIVQQESSSWHRPVRQPAGRYRGSYLQGCCRSTALCFCTSRAAASLQLHYPLLLAPLGAFHGGISIGCRDLASIRHPRYKK